MSKKIEFPALTENDIDVRVQAVYQTKQGVGAVLLLYKNARVDMRLLDETVGPFGWRRTHQVINGNLFCSVSIKDPDSGEWITKEDVGVESNTEKEKGQASDAFKRACFNWGIGRELYTAPFIWINLNEGEWAKDSNGKAKLKNSVKFLVQEVTVTKEQAIASLKIADNAGKIRYQR